MRVHLAALVLALSGCAVDGTDSNAGDDDVECTGDKCDDLGEPGVGGVLVSNPCPLDLTVGVARKDARDPASTTVIPKGGVRRLAGDPGDRLMTTDVGGGGWRTVEWIEASEEIDLDRGWCPWDVIVESASVVDRTADGRAWDQYAAGGYALPDTYVTGYGDGEAVNCMGHAGVVGTPTSTASDTTAPEWDQETLSWVAWHDLSSALELVLTDDDVGPGGELIGACSIEMPPPEELPSVITADCAGGSVTVRIDPADGDPVATGVTVILGSCS